MATQSDIRMPEAKHALPSLDRCIKCIKSICSESSWSGSRKEASLYTSCIAFLVYLQTDRATIERNGKDSYPSEDEIPAISAIFKDNELFYRFLSLLSSKEVQYLSNNGTSTTANGKSKTPSTNVPFPNKRQGISNLSRKRSFSIASDHSDQVPISNKSMKILHSPKPDIKMTALGGSTATKIVPIIDRKHSMDQGMVNSNVQPQIMNLPVLAALIFYVSFLDLDHWPALLAKAFAEDSFGPRRWVDDDRCSSFVENLNSTAPKDAATETSNFSQAASFFEHSFQSYLKTKSKSCAEDETCTSDRPAHGPAHLEPSITSALIDSGSESDSGGEECVLEVSSGSALKYSDPLAEHTKQINSSTEFTSSLAGAKIQTSKKNSHIVGDVKSTDKTARKSAHLDQHHHDDSWWRPKTRNTRHRCRFWGSNKMLAHEMIAQALVARLDAKLKQNSKLLNTLPSFMSVSQVRRLVASQLEKWLQSPALSGLARPLFSTLTSEIKNVEPPLDDDIETISIILSMTLKATQFTAHVENITDIVKRVPTVSISRHILLHLLRKELNKDDVEEPSSDVSDNLRMLRAVFKSLAANVAYGSLASSILIILFSENQHSRIGDICNLIRTISNLLGKDYDGYLLIKRLVESDFEFIGDASINKINLFARTLFECAIQMVPPAEYFSLSSNRPKTKVPRNNGLVVINDVEPTRDVSEIAPKLLAIRKVLLKWCLKVYLLIESKHGYDDKTSNGHNNGNTIPSPLNYQSVLDGITTAGVLLSSIGVNLKKVIRMMRCLTFLEEPSSHEIATFLESTPSIEGVKDEVNVRGKNYQIQTWCEYGGDVDNELIRIVLESVECGHYRAKKEMAISLIEQLLHKCRKGENSKILIDDVNIIWELYNLAEDASRKIQMRKWDTANDCVEVEGEIDNSTKCTNRDGALRLAYPDLWWRVTAISLVICGKSPSGIASKLWNEMPTLRALIKMATASQYKFPTVDLDIEEKEMMNRQEKKVKEKEMKIAEFLFLPNERNKVKKNNAKPQNGSYSPNPLRLRASARQKAKQARLLAIQREKELVLQHAEEQRIKKLLRVAQKSVMMWCPKYCARKPPKDAFDLIVSVDKMFNLSDGFRSCLNPDFLLETIGSTTRDSIERAYDWLIPVISSSPKLIKRLPSSASGFLLLRAYGNESKQLLELTSPLLHHVAQCLIGEYGKESTQRAADLLFFDIADRDPNRRRCARQVLQESLAGLNDVVKDKHILAMSNFLWLFVVPQTIHANILMASAIPRLGHALIYERGEVLRAYIHALNHYIVVKQCLEKCNFAHMICDLISTRPHVCRTLMDRYTDIRILFIEIIHDEFERSRTLQHVSKERIILMKINVNDSKVAIHIAPSLLRATLIMMSSSPSDEKEDVSTINPNIVSNSLFEHGKKLMMLIEYFVPLDTSDSIHGEMGVASTELVESGERAVSVEEWVMLTKSRWSLVAKRSVLSVPAIFLPRLLLCCGLPKTSFLSIMDRLEKLGSTSTDQDKCYARLLSPSAINEWEYFGKRRQITRKLLGRISAYAAVFQHNTSNNAFVDWIFKEHANSDQMNKRFITKNAKGRKAPSNELRTVPLTRNSIQSIFSDHEEDIDSTCKVLAEQNVQFKCLEMPSVSASRNIHLIDLSIVTDDGFRDLFLRNEFRQLNSILASAQNESEAIKLRVVSKVLTCFRRLQKKLHLAVSLVLKWIPVLSSQCESSFWDILFSAQRDSTEEDISIDLMLVTQCMSVWSMNRVLNCQKWLLERVHEKGISNICASTSVRCLLVNLQHTSPYGHVTSSDGVFIPLVFSHDQTKAAIAIALDEAKGWFKKKGKITLCETSDWMNIILNIGKLGKKYVDLISKTFVDSLPSDSWEGKVFPVTLLRLYAHYPTVISLGDAKIRNVLVNASAQMASEFIKLRNPLDDRIEISLSNLTKNPIQRQQQVISELCKRYPLTVIRYLSFFIEVLDTDAKSVAQHEAIRRGLICFKKEPVIGKIQDKSIAVTIVHWGYNFTEALWISVLDIISSFPQEVLGVCGSKMGLLDLVDVYLKLLKVQYDLGGYIHIERVRMKFSNTMEKIKASNPCQWEERVEKSILGLKNSGSRTSLMRDILQVEPEKVLAPTEP